MWAPPVGELPDVTVTEPPPLTVISWAWVIVNECVWLEFDEVVFVIPAAGGVWTSALSIVTVWVWELLLVDVNVFDVPGLSGVVEFEHPVEPAVSRAKKAAPAMTVKTLLGDI